MRLKTLFFSITLLFLPLFVFAGGGGDIVHDFVTSWSTRLVVGASILVVLFVLLAQFSTNLTETKKKVYFWGITIPVILASAFIAIATVYLNVVSVTKGPVHWHADFKILNCGEELNLKDPEGLSNKIGTPVLHEHSDFRVHVEGVVTELRHVSLESFFRVIGGSASAQELILPTNDGLVALPQSGICSGGSVYDGQRAYLQAFLYTVDGDTVTQEKMGGNWPEYVLSPYQSVPPGDCIIFEFGPEKTQTDQICNFYQIAIDKGELTPTNF